MAFSVSEKAEFIEKAFGKGAMTRTGTNISVRCPVKECASRKDRSKKKLSIRIEDDLNHCWVCGWGARSLAPLLIKYCDENLLHEYKERFAPHVKTHQQTETKDVKLSLPPRFRFLATASKNDPDVLVAWNYIFQRGLNESHVWRFKLGVSDDPKWKSRIIFLSHDEAGELNFYVGRSMHKKVWPKYEAPDHVKSTDIIFNELNVDWKQRLTICEGPFDLTKCGENAVCLLGSNFSEKSTLFNKILLNKTPIAIALDSDMPHKTQAYAKKLYEYDIDVKTVDLGDRHDPGEMSQEEFAEHLSAAKSFSWIESFKSKLSMI